MAKKLLIFSICVLCLTLSILWKHPDPSVSFSNSYAEVGVPLEVIVSGYSRETEFSYQWTIGDDPIDWNENYYIPTAQDLEKFIHVIVTPSDHSQEVTLSTYFSRLPVLYLSVEEEIDRKIYTSGTMKLQGNSLYSQEEQLYTGPIQIHGRGNSTWGAYPKKPYKLKLDTAADLFGMGRNKHWVLFANFADESLMRNKIAYDLSGALGMPYMESTWVSVIFNGQYAGNYLLCEQIRIDENRIDITDLTDYTKTVANVLIQAEAFPKRYKEQLELTLEQDLQWLSTGIFTFEGVEYDITPYMELPDLTGGFLLEIDAYFDEISKFFAQTQPVMFKNPEYACTNEEIMTYADDYFTAAFEAILESEDFYSDYHGVPTSYTQLFDIRSLAQYVLLQEIFFNYDAALKSMYLYKDVDDVAYMGPIWDEDWSSGRTHSNYSIQQWWTVYFTENADETLWYSGLIRDPYFLSMMKDVWDDSLDAILALTAEDGTIASAYQYIYESGMANTATWPYEYGFERSYETFLAWMKERLAWLEPQFSDLETLVESVGYYQADPSLQIRHTQEGIYLTSPIGTSAVLYYNDIRISEQPIQAQTAFWNADTYTVCSDSDVIQIRVYDENGVLLGSNYMDLRN